MHALVRQPPSRTEQKLFGCELECDKVTGAISLKANGETADRCWINRTFHPNDLSATLDSILRLSFERTDLPLLFDEEQNGSFHYPAQ